MSFFGNKPITRRAAIAVAMTSCAMVRSGTIAARQTDRPAPFDLGHGLEIRDYRLFPTEDVIRFIVEIHNTTDTAVDTPTIGVVLPHFDEGNFGWANPAAPVLHPRSSGCLIGVAPHAVATDDDWGSPEWVLCNPIESIQSDYLNKWDISWSESVELLSSTHLKSTLEFKNDGTEESPILAIQGIVTDVENRLCGVTVAMQLPTLSRGESRRNAFSIIEEAPNIANPFVLIEDVRGIKLLNTLQTRASTVNGNCQVVMPWTQ